MLFGSQRWPRCLPKLECLSQSCTGASWQGLQSWNHCSVSQGLSQDKCRADDHFKARRTRRETAHFKDGIVSESPYILAWESNNCHAASPSPSLSLAPQEKSNWNVRNNVPSSTTKGRFSQLREAGLWRKGNSGKGTDTRAAEKELRAWVKCRQAAQWGDWQHFNIATASFCRAERIVSSPKNNRAAYFIVCFLGSDMVS